MKNFRVFFVVEEHDVMDIEATDEADAMKWFDMHKDFVEGMDFRNKVVLKKIEQVDPIEGEGISKF